MSTGVGRVWLDKAARQIVIDGTGGDDVAEVYSDKGRVRVRLSSTDAAGFVHVAEKRFRTKQVQALVFHGHGGADSLQNHAGITLPPNIAPSFVAGANLSVAEDAGKQAVAWASAIRSGSPDESWQTLQFLTVTDNRSLFVEPPVVAADGTLRYTPMPNAHGTAQVSVRLQDNGGVAGGGRNTSDEQTFSITIRSVNDAPSFTGGPHITATEDAGPQLFPHWATAITSGSDNESGQMLAFDVTNDSPALFSVQPVVAPDGTLSFTPAPDAYGTAVVSVRLWDDGGLADGGRDTSELRSFTVTIAPVDDPPSFTAGPDVVTYEDAGPQSLVGWASNITDDAADRSTRSFVFQAATDNLGLFSEQPTVLPNGVLTFTPSPESSGTATVSVRLVSRLSTSGETVESSAVQTFHITVRPVNDRPAIVLGPGIVTREDAGPQWVDRFGRMVSGPADEAAQVVVPTLTTNKPELFSVQPSLSDDGTLTYTPAADASGVATVTVRVRDNGGADYGGLDEGVSQTFTITIRPVNDAPSFVAGADITVLEDAGPQSVAWASQIRAGGADESGQGTYFAVSTDYPALFDAPPRVAADGTLTFQTAPNANGSANVSVWLLDTGGTALGGENSSTEHKFTIVVQPTNDTPSFAIPASHNVREDAGAQVIARFATAISRGGIDESGQEVRFLVTATNPDLFEVPPSISPDGTLSYTPRADMHGAATVTVQLQEVGDSSQISASQTFTVSVAPVNDAPGFVVGADQIVIEDDGPQVVPNWATAVSAGPAGESAQTLTFRVSTDNDGLFSQPPTLAADGTLRYTPAANASGTARVTVRLTDDGGTQNGGVQLGPVAVFEIDIIPVNDSPIGLADIPVMTTDNVLLGHVLANDLDADGDLLSAELVRQADHGGVALADNGLFLYLPDAGFVGFDSFEYVVSDGSEESRAVTVVVEVLPDSRWCALNLVGVPCLEFYGGESELVSLSTANPAQVADLLNDPVELAANVVAETLVLGAWLYGMGAPDPLLTEVFDTILTSLDDLLYALSAPAPTGGSSAPPSSCNTGDYVDQVFCELYAELPRLQEEALGPLAHVPFEVIERQAHELVMQNLTPSVVSTIGTMYDPNIVGSVSWDIVQMYRI
jgi:hypothetical protein